MESVTVEVSADDLQCKLGRSWGKPQEQVWAIAHVTWGIEKQLSCVLYMPKEHETLKSTRGEVTASFAGRAASLLKTGQLSAFAENEVHFDCPKNVTTREGIATASVLVSQTTLKKLEEEWQFDHAAKKCFDAAVEKLRRYSGYSVLEGDVSQIRGTLSYLEECLHKEWLGMNGWYSEKFLRIRHAFERLIDVKNPNHSQCRRHRDEIRQCLSGFTRPNVWRGRPPVMIPDEN